MKRKRRLKILTELEQRLYYQRPYFDEEERYYFFKLSEEECALVENKSPTVMIYTILQLGYFKAKQQFFKVNYSDIQADWAWIQRQHIIQPIHSHKLPSRNIQTAIKHKIAAFFGYQTNLTLIKSYLQEQIERLVRQSNDPVILFKELFLSLKQNKMVLPGYTTMQDIISKASTAEEARLYKLIEQHLNFDIKNQLAVLLNNEDELNSLREIKKDLSGFNYSAMKKEIYLHQLSQALYGSAKAMLLHFQLAEQAIIYYANCINYYSIYELRRMHKTKCYLYLLCYIYYRYQQMNDSLIQAFIYHVDKIKKTASIHAAKVFLQQQKTLLADPKSIGVLIGNYANEPLLKLNKKFNEVAKEAYQLMSKEIIAQISQQMIKQTNYQTELEWQYYHDHRQYMELNLRPIFKALIIQADKNDHPLIEGATFLKAIFAKGTTMTRVSSSQFPKRAIPKKFKEIILDTKGNVRPYHYEFLVYYKLREYLVKNIIYLNDSVHYKSFIEDSKTSFISKETKEVIFKKMNKPKLLVPIKDRLIELEQEVEALYVEVNQAIASG